MRRSTAARRSASCVPRYQSRWTAAPADPGPARTRRPTRRRCRRRRRRGRPRRARRSARGRRRARAAPRRARPASPAGTTRPLRPSRTSPPAAAPTASVAMIAVPWFMASLTTSPHGSMKRRVAIDGTTRTSLARVEVAQNAPDRADAGRGARRRRSGPCSPTTRERAVERGAPPRLERDGEPLLAARRARRTAPRSARVAARRGGRRTRSALSTACGATSTFARAVRAHVGADVLAVGDDRGRVPVDPAHQRQRREVRGGARRAPQRRPEHERHAARGARARQAAGSATRPPVPAIDGAVGAARDERADLALARRDGAARRRAAHRRPRRAGAARRTARARSGALVQRARTRRRGPAATCPVTNRTGFTRSASS